MTIKYRPQILERFHGQPAAVSRVKAAIATSLARARPLESMLILGAPGSGRSSLAHVIADECASPQYVIETLRGSSIAEQVADFADQLRDRDVVIIEDLDRMEFWQFADASAIINARPIVTCRRRPQLAPAAQITLPDVTIIATSSEFNPGNPKLLELFKRRIVLDSYDDSAICRILSDAVSQAIVCATRNMLSWLAAHAYGRPSAAVRLLSTACELAWERGASKATLADARRSFEIEAIDLFGCAELEAHYLARLTRVGGRADSTQLRQLLDWPTRVIRRIEDALIGQRAIVRQGNILVRCDALVGGGKEGEHADMIPS